MECRTLAPARVRGFKQKEGDLMLNLDECLGANRPLIFVVTESDMEVLQYINRKYKEHHFFVYSTTSARSVPLPDLLKNRFHGSGKSKSQTTVECLTEILTRDFNTTNNKFETYIFLNADSYINDKQVIRRIKDIIARYQLDEGFTVNMIFMSQTVSVPMDLERLTEVVFFDLPTSTELEELSDFLTKKLDLKDDTKGGGKDRRPSPEVINNLKGLTKFEVEQAYLQSFHLFKQSEGLGRIDLNFIREFKKSAIAKTDLLSLMESGVTFESIGGLSILKEWVKKCYGGWTVKGREFGLPILKGLLMVGLPGCGKSLLAKSIGNEWGLPVLNFDPTRIFSSRVGDSEANMRRVLQIVENISPCLMGDTVVTLSDGSVTSIKDMYENGYRGTVPSINPSFEVENSNVILITKKKSSEVFNLRTTVGNIKATGNHRFPILKSNGELHWIRTDHLQEGDFILSPRKFNIGLIPSMISYFDENSRFSSTEICRRFLTKIKSEDPKYYKKHGRRIAGKSGIRSGKNDGFVFKHEIDEYSLSISGIQKISLGGGGYRDSSVNRMPSKAHDLMYALGLLWSDGNIGDKNYNHYDLPLKKRKEISYRTKDTNTTKFVNTCKHLHNQLNRIMKAEFGIDLKTYAMRGTVRVTSEIPLIASRFLRRLQKDMPSFEESLIWSWLSGVMDGDGHVAPNKIVFSATKHRNNEYLRDVLIRIGIPTSNSVDDGESTRIEITTGSHLALMKKHLKLHHPKKKKTLATLATDHDGSRFDVLNVRDCLKDILFKKGFISNDDPFTCKDEKRKQIILSDKLPARIRGMIHDYVDRDQLLSIEKIQEIFLACGENPWFLSNFIFAKINEVNPIQGEHDVYDLCLDKNHNFIANRMFTHNCVLFIDEIEKGFAGMQSSTFSDSGVTARVIGSFLIWLQECTAPVFTVATSNAIHYMPPELISRFDECFFVNMPQANEREEILNIHLRKLNRDPEKFDVKSLADISQDLSGRELEQALKESMYDAFHSGEELTTEVIHKVLSRKTSLLTTMAEQLNFLLKWVGWDPEKKDGIRARFASPIQEMDRARVMSEIDKMLKEVSDKPLDGPSGLLPGSGDGGKC